MFGWFVREKLDRLWLYIALSAFVVILVVNGLAGGTTLLGGVQTAEVSDIYGNLFAPAGFTFSIWGVIYVLLGVFMARSFGLIKTTKPQLKNKEMNDLVALFTVSSLLNAAWLLVWQFQYLTLSVAIMVCLLVILTKIMQLLRTQKMSLGDYACIRVPFSVYLGWISVATIANITSWLVSIEWDGFGVPDATWMVIVLIVGALIGVIKSIANRDPVYGMVFIWAYVGILYKHMSSSGFDGQYSEIIVTLSILLPVLVSVVIGLLREHEQAQAFVKQLARKTT